LDMRRSSQRAIDFSEKLLVLRSWIAKLELGHSIYNGDLAMTVPKASKNRC
jgi:hypothetical protein